MDVSSRGSESLDGFYHELRRKYPNTFTLAPDLGKGDGPARKLPHLENTPPKYTGIPLNPLPSAPQKWTPDGFLSKVKLQKSQNEQRQDAEAPRVNGAAVVIQDKTIPVSAWNRRDHVAAQTRASVRLPSLRTQVEQNKAELKNRLVSSRTISEEPKIRQSPTVPLNRDQKTESRSSKESISTLESPTNPSATKSDALGTIMKELLPSKPGRWAEMPKAANTFYRNDGAISDSDSAVSVCAPLKIFRPKIRSPHDAPAPSDIIRKFSTKPQPHPGPLRADHSVLPGNVTATVKPGETGEKIFFKKSSINYSEKMQQRPVTARVRFEDESEEETQARYQQRHLQERHHTTEITSDILPKPAAKPLEKMKTQSTQSTPPSPTTSEKSSSGQYPMNLPYRRQPFPPNIAKKVLIDVPRGGLPNRRQFHIRMPPAMNDKQLSPTNSKEATSLDGISMSFTTSSLEWKEQSPMAKMEENKNHTSFSSLESIGTGITEVSSEVTITTLEWRGSGSSVASEKQARPVSQPQHISLDSPSLGKGKEVSFYSRVKSRLHVKMKLSSDNKELHGSRLSDLSNPSDSGSQNSKNEEISQRSDASQKFDRREKIVSHGKSKPHGANSPFQVIKGENVSSSISKDRMKMDASQHVEAQNTDSDVSGKAPYLSRKVQSLLKKGRAKNYVVGVPSPPSQDSRPHSDWPAVSAKRLRNIKMEDVLEQGSSKLLARKSDVSRLVELQRPTSGFRGLLHLSKRSQDRHSGLYVVQLSRAFTSSFPLGILNVGDEILEINGRHTKDLSMEEIHSLLEESSCVLLRVLAAANGI